MDIGKGLESLIPRREEPAGEEKEESAGQGNSFKEPLFEKPAGEEQFPPPSERASGEKEEGIVFQIETEKVQPNPHQPRRHFDETELRELAASIREFGIIQPLVVSKIEKESEWGWSVTYELIAGERRLMAAKLLGLQTVPAIIRRAAIPREKLELAVIENIQRTDLNPIEFARAVSRLQDEFGLTQREIAARLGKSREVIANSIRLLGLPTEMQEAVATGRVSASQARLLLSVDDIAERERIFEEILKDKLSVREVKSRVKRSKGESTESAGEDEEGQGDAFADPELAMIRGELEEFLGTKVELKSRGSGGGKLTISYYSPEELHAIVEKFFRDRESL